MTDQIPQTPVKPAKRSLWERVSLVWVVPIAALVIALGIAWQAYQDRGALIEIAFAKASGIVAEQTQLRFREVSVGVVETVAFSDDLAQVIAHVRVDKEVEPFIDADAVFWVVQPEVSARGISGLDTVLGGVYIEGSWDNTPGGLQRHFTGLEDRPVARPDQKGREITLTTTTGKGLSEGTPILFKGIEVGRVGKPQLSPDGVTITAQAFINSPHDQLMTTRSRFWDASGFSFNLGAGGASVDVESIASLITGGISFETVVSGGAPVPDGQRFSVFASQDDARASLFEAGGPDGANVEIAMVFEENVQGLAVGAPVTLRGLEIGEVVGLTGRVDEAQFGDDRVRLIVVLSIGLEQLQLGEGATDAEEILDFFDDAVAEGWRARLARAGLLSSALRIELVQVPDAEPARFLRDGDPYPIFPSVAGETSGGSVGASAEGLLQRVNDLPVEELMANVITFVESATALVSSEDLQSIPSEVRGAVEDVRTVIGNADLQALPERVNGIADELLAVLADLEEREGVAKLVEAVEQAGEAAAEVGESVAGVPDLIERIDAVVLKAEALDLEGLLDQAKGLAESANTLIGAEATRALPETLSEALGGVDDAVQQATTLMSDLNEADAVSKLTGAIESASAAAADIGTAAEGLPDLIDQIRAVAAKAEAMDLDALVDEVTGLVESADALIGTAAAQALPESLNAALDEVSGALSDLREGGTVESVNAALASAEQAADSVARASSELPDLVRRTEAVLREAELAMAGLAESGALNREARAALREISRAADSVRSLARTLERKPNALLTGK
ncbi:paraquat-inducible protein B [Aliiruegeria haliotis]|uniref:Paraquat-inducible protein B n=1 Tax=Aliiruegeria haliotis TaxID=1280846 RepID=A0A2T0RSL9_9RHOB|nr:MlaD family protein [Aliiruegeria haliotis]PRY24186.1 paraquat-inducible protein B [Aliiruegeria haliotis]